ncbi:MAG: sulfotransferase domain-containing protein [Synechocystis sp.]|nr:sulfotransferase domain-containing protein [Synechocystis sp.]
MENSKNIIWVASYPKSGNTWVRNILAQLLFKTTSFAETLHYIRDIYQIQDGQTLMALPETNLGGKKVSLVKIHCQFCDLPTQSWGINIRTIGFIYIYRHPLDVLLSAINYWRLERCATDFFEDSIVQTPDELVQVGKIDGYLERFSQDLTIQNWASMAGSWDKNVFSWLNAATDYPLTAVFNYRRLLADPVTEIGKICDLLPMINHQSLTEALNYAQKVREYDPNLDSPELEYFKKVFFWKGKRENYREYFSELAIKSFYHQHQQLLIDLDLFETVANP